MGCESPIWPLVRHKFRFNVLSHCFWQITSQLVLLLYKTDSDQRTNFTPRSNWGEGTTFYDFYWNLATLQYGFMALTIAFIFSIFSFRLIFHYLKDNLFFICLLHFNIRFSLDILSEIQVFIIKTIWFINNAN